MAAKRPTVTLNDKEISKLGTCGDYYYSGTVSVAARYQKKSFGFISQSIILSNDDGITTVMYSFDGLYTHGELYPGESITFDKRHRDCIYVNAVGSGTPSIRIWAW